MLGNCDQKKMIVISSNTNEWPQVRNQIDERKKLMASTGRNMEKPIQDQQQQQPLNCPRCDSTNTKFCYYNNYSSSQPRHFCKACRRYWTRGGTLRNVPVGGGCRKNKRIRRPVSAGDVTSSSAPTVTTNPSAQVQTQTDLSSNSNNHMNPLFYSLPSNHIELNLPYSSNFSNTVSGFNLQPQINALGLGFQSGLFVNNDHYKNGFNFSKQIQDVITPSSSVLSSNPIFGSSTFASVFQQPKFINSSGLQNHSQAAADNLQGLISYEDLQMPRNGGNSTMVKELKTEGAENRLDSWNISNQNQIEQMNSSDPSLLWNPTGVGAWLDPSNMGSSVSSLM